MKQELPIAIALLATGCMLWIWQSNPANTANAARQTASPASPQSEVPAKQKTQMLASGKQANASGNEFLSDVGRSFENGDSRLGDFEIVSQLFGKQQNMKGRFWMQGSGSAKSRIELITDSTSPSKLTHVCDGRFTYRLREHHDKRELKFVDLHRLNNEDASIIRETLPASWVGAGSPGTMIRHLSQAFDFQMVESEAQGGSRQVDMLGTWNLKHLSKLMINHLDHREIIGETKWSKLPPHFPHTVRLRLVNRGNSLWQPTEIQFYQFDEKQDAVNSPGKMILAISFKEFQSRSLSEDLFRLDFNESGAIDETDLYNQRIDLLTGNNRVAETVGGTVR